MGGRILMRHKGCIEGRTMEGQGQTQFMRHSNWATCMSGRDWLASRRMEARPDQQSALAVGSNPSSLPCAVILPLLNAIEWFNLFHTPLFLLKLAEQCQHHVRPIETYHASGI